MLGREPKWGKTHGRWIEFRFLVNGVPELMYKCSECGNMEGFPDDAKYCSNCGSKMDKPVLYLPDKKCKLCTASSDGTRQGCVWAKCKCDEPYYCEEQVAHGHWNPGRTDGFKECSVCGYQLYTPFLEGELYWCPKCGAHLDGYDACKG